MKRVEQRVSPAQFAALREALMRAEIEGHGPDACARMALAAIGLHPEEPQETVFVVDPMMIG